MLYVAANNIGRIMGLKRELKNIDELVARIERGLPKDALSNTLKFIGAQGEMKERLANRVVSLATYKRRKLLKPDEGEKVARIARVIAYALFVWDDQDEARRFLLSPHPMLDNKRPIDLAFSELGAMRVEHVLSGLLDGAAA